MGKRGSFPERPCSLCQASSVSFSREARASLPRVTYLSPHSTPGPGSQQNSTEKMTQCVSSHTCVHTHTHTHPLQNRPYQKFVALVNEYLSEGSPDGERTATSPRADGTCILQLECELLLPSHFSHVQLCATLWTVARQVPLSTGFSRQD